MRILVIEDRVYKVTEEHFKALTDKQEELDNKPYYHGKDVDMDDFIQELIPYFKLIGIIFFSFRI